MNIKNLTLHEKIGQMLCFAFHGTEFNSQLREQIEDLKIGGVIHFARNIVNIKQTAKLNKDIQNCTKIPMFIGLDQEGGSVLRVMDSITPLPGAMALAAADADIYKINNMVGKDLVKLGFNMNFAPVGDVNNNPLNPVINSRSYSDNPNKVAELASLAFKGFQDAKLLPTMKHFPGHGNTNVDSHIGLPVVKATKEEINETELVPFKKAIQDGIDGIMISHILYEAYDKVYPATLSYNIITKLLKEELGFKGLIVTDSLTMGAINSRYSKSEIVLNGINAGNDILIFCGRADINEQKEIFNSFVKLVEEGKIPITRIDESVQKILDFKSKYCNVEFNIENIEEKVGNKDEIKFAKKIQDESVTLVKSNYWSHIKENEKVLLIFPKIKLFSLVDNENQTYKTINEYLGFDELIINDEFNDYDLIKEKIQKYDKVIMATYNVTRDDYQCKIFNLLDKPKTMVVSMRSPYDILHLNGVENYMCIYEATHLSFESCARLLKAEANYKGILPIKL